MRHATNSETVTGNKQEPRHLLTNHLLTFTNETGNDNNVLTFSPYTYLHRIMLVNKRSGRIITKLILAKQLN